MHHCACKTDWPILKPVIVAKFLAGADNYDGLGDIRLNALPPEENMAHVPQH
jgi:hypothetical protein